MTISKTLWEVRLRGGGFEDALSLVQGAYASNKSDETQVRLDQITRAVIGMFDTMQAAFNKLDYRGLGLQLQQFLSRFDAIFTLIRDTLLETLYAGQVRWSERWYGSYLPYMKFLDEPTSPYPFMLRQPMIPDSECIMLKTTSPFISCMAPTIGLPNLTAND